MQHRQTNRKQYFNELAHTSRHYFIPYIEQYLTIEPDLQVLEIGCGDGGNLLPFAQKGCRVVGVDLASQRIADAKRFFHEAKATGLFVDVDVFEIQEMEHRFDIVICHDVIEHIPNKAAFLQKTQSLLTPNGVVFMAFPAWQMPFGGHQQICRSGVLSRFPFLHLLPKRLYQGVLKLWKESDDCINELLHIRKTRCPIELFEHTLQKSHFETINRTLYFINPHYEVKFGLRPRKLPRWIGALPYVRNFFTTSCFYLLTLQGSTSIGEAID